MTFNGNELARRSAGAIQMRPEPLRMRVKLEDLQTSDSHLIDVAFTCSVAALDRRGEREMFAETFLSHRASATSDDVAAHFASALKRASLETVSSEAAEHWLVGANADALAKLVADAAKKLAFACGVELLPPFDLAVSSPSLEREKLEATGRKLSERRTAGQVAHVQQAAELLKQFETLRQAMPSLTPGQLLDRVSPADRGSMLQSLLMASASAGHAMLWAVAGPNLVKIDPRSSPAKMSIIPVPSDLGPLRSVQGAGGKLLVGAQAGVLVIDPNDLASATLLRDPETKSQLGFNSAVMTGDIVWASHSEAGVVAWQMSQPDAPLKVFRDAPGAKNLVALDDARVIYSSELGVSVESLDAAGAGIHVPDALGVVQLIHVADARITIVGSSGQTAKLDRHALAITGTQRRSGEISGAGVLPWLGSTRLLLATCDGPVYCVGEDDSLVTQYASPHRGLRAIAACADVIAALSADRQRIVLWNSWQPDAPLAEIHIAATARHRAADLCFA